jgi:glycosyltransferase involved in cell wall biosynthesis
LKERCGDHQFYLCATGKSGFKLTNIINRLNSKATFMDVGANIGLYSIIATQHKNISQVISIEPNPTALDYLKDNITYNKAHTVKVLEGTVSKNSATVELCYENSYLRKGGIEYDGSHKITVKSYNRNSLSTLFLNIKDEVFLKVVIEGAEREVLEEIFAASHSNKIKYAFVEITPRYISKDKIQTILGLMRLNGFKLDWHSSDDEQYGAYFIRDENYLLAADIKKKLLNNIAKKPKYSVCVPNYNMSDSIYQAISSVARQLNDEYEILIIDDGSNDNSKKIIQQLEIEFPIVRAIFLQRDKNRYLGETRNFSIYSALGDYVLLHIDADDVWDAHLQDLVKLFHHLEKAYDREFYLVGQQTGIAKRELMLTSGGYENIYRGEDRNLMFNLAKQDKILFLDYKTFRRRLNRPANKKYIKVVWDMWSHIHYDLMYCEKKFQYILVALFFSYNNSDFTAKTRVLRALMIMPAWACSVFAEKRSIAMGWEEFLRYRELRRGNFEAHMERVGLPVKLSDIVTGKSEEIFNYQMSNKGFKGE